MLTVSLPLRAKLPTDIHVHVVSPNWIHQTTEKKYRPLRVEQYTVSAVIRGLGYITYTWQGPFKEYTVTHGNLRLFINVSRTKPKAYHILSQRCLWQPFQDLQTKVVCLPLLTCKVRSQQSMTGGTQVCQEG